MREQIASNPDHPHLETYWVCQDLTPGLAYTRRSHKI